MAQEYQAQGAPTKSGLVRTYVTNLQTNEDTLRSNFSGTSFPSNPVVGQHFFRTGTNKEYTWNGNMWQEVGVTSKDARDVQRARGSLPSLSDRLNVALNEDGTIRADSMAEVDEWKGSSIAATFISEKQFSVAGDLRSTFTSNRVIKAYNSDNKTAITTVKFTTYNAGKTYVTTYDKIFDAGLTAVKYSLIQYSDYHYRLERGCPYSVGEIISDSALTGGLKLKCVVAGTTSNVRPDFSNVVENSTFTDGNVGWQAVTIPTRQEVEDMLKALENRLLHKDDFWEIKADGALTPAENPIYSETWNIKENGAFTPAENPRYSEFWEIKTNGALTPKNAL